MLLLAECVGVGLSLRHAVVAEFRAELVLFLESGGLLRDELAGPCNRVRIHAIEVCEELPEHRAAGSARGRKAAHGAVAAHLCEEGVLFLPFALEGVGLLGVLRRLYEVGSVEAEAAFVGTAEHVVEILVSHAYEVGHEPLVVFLLLAPGVLPAVELREYLVQSSFLPGQVFGGLAHEGDVELYLDGLAVLLHLGKLVEGRDVRKLLVRVGYDAQHGCLYVAPEH